MEYTYDYEGSNPSPTHVPVSHHLLIRAVVTINSRFLAKSKLAAPSSLIMPWLLILVYFLNMPCCWHTWKCQPIACRVSIPIWSHKTQKWEFKKRAPITWFTKFNYLEKRWFVVRLGWPSHKLNANEYARRIMDSLVPHRLSAQYGSHATTRVRSRSK